MKYFVFVLFLVAVATARPCDEKDNKGKLWCDLNKSFDERARELVKELTLDEKISLIHNTASSVDRLHISGYEWWSEALHGVAGSPGVHFRDKTPYATSFPQVSTTACSFNSTLFHDIAEAISAEAHVFYNYGNAGLTFWTPNINIVRDPRWGRGQETPGEDPILSATYAANFVRGLQEGEDPKYLKASACCKHFTAYDLENWMGIERHNFDALVSDADMEDTFQVPFESCVVLGKVSSLMCSTCSYNRVNGVPSCANEELLTVTARDKWGFDGYITGDCGAIDDIPYRHKWNTDSGEVLQSTLSAGTDVDCGGYYPSYAKEAVRSGKLDVRYINRALTNLFKVQMRLGLFDPLENQPYSKYDVDLLEHPQHIKLAEEASEQGIVLLKNLNDVLPLDKTKYKTISVIGPHGNDTFAPLGNYFGTPSYVITPVMGLSKYAQVQYFKGCDNFKCNTINDEEAILESVANSDLTVLTMGISNDIEAEGKDRYQISIPGKQQELIEKVTKKAKGIVLLVVASGSSLDIKFARDNDKISGIFWTGYAAQQGGEALAKLIFGDANPSGRLVYTIYPAGYIDHILYTDMNMRPNPNTNKPGRTYRYYGGEVVYPFGYGLSYSTFSYSVSTSESSLSADRIKEQLLAETRFEAESMLTVKVNVKNTSDRDGSTSVLVYAVPPGAGSNDLPIKQLITFTKVIVPAKGSVDVELPVSGYAFSVNTDGKRRAVTGDWKVVVEDQSTSVIVN